MPMSHLQDIHLSGGTMRTDTFYLAKGNKQTFEEGNQRVQLYAKEDTFVVEYSSPEPFHKPKQVFLTLPDALRVYHWFTKSIKHGYL